MNYDDRPWLAHYDVGVPESIDVPEISLVDLLAQSVERFWLQNLHHPGWQRMDLR